MENPNTHIFRFCPACGSGSLFPSGPKSFACSDCTFSFFINCAAAAMALIVKDDALLVTVRKFDPDRGKLDLPGGFAEPGEGIEETLIRELREELNLEVNSMDYFCSVFNAYPFGKVTYPVTDMAFVCRVDDFSGLTPGDDVENIRFIRIPELDPEDFGLASAPQVIRKFKAEWAKPV